MAQKRYHRRHVNKIALQIDLSNALNTAKHEAGFRATGNLSHQTLTLAIRHYPSATTAVADGNIPHWALHNSDGAVICTHDHQQGQDAACIRTAASVF